MSTPRCPVCGKEAKLISVPGQPDLVNLICLENPAHYETYRVQNKIGKAMKR